MKLFIRTLIIWFLLLPISAAAQETVTILYQNDIHGWMFPSSNRVGMGRMARILETLFDDEPSSFYAVSGDLFTGPNLPDAMKGVAELEIWNRFRRQMADQGYGDRVLISAGNHEFDYGAPAPAAFSGGLLCANVVDADGRPVYMPYRVVETEEGLRVGFLGLLLEGNSRVDRSLADGGLKTIPKSTAVERFLPMMGRLDLTILMIHDHVQEIVSLVESLPPQLGVDIVLSGHEHLVLEAPLRIMGVYILQAGAMNNMYGHARLSVHDGKVLSLENRIVPLRPSSLDRAMMRVKEKVDERNGKTVAVLETSLEGVYQRGGENSLGDFVTDAFRWATQADVAMTNSASLRSDFPVVPGETFELKEGHFKTMTPFGNRLVVGEVTGAQILQILEGEAVSLKNQVSGLRYTMDLRRAPGNRIVAARIAGETIRPEAGYTLAHNDYCALPENMKRYLHLAPGAIDWKATDLLDYEALIAFAQSLGRIRYP
ncbi:MAG: bifunctional metallophosphatase/5'-nucleotidase, partial [Deltaproteobacteria bacterium]|nr:bifunctional metallophosphatase/5'-nucleotidase [Deltaproteobacteria bacterium]